MFRASGDISDSFIVVTRVAVDYHVTKLVIYDSFVVTSQLITMWISSFTKTFKVFAKCVVINEQLI